MEQLTRRTLWYIVRLFYYFGDLVGLAGQMQKTSKETQDKFFSNPGFITIFGVFGEVIENTCVTYNTDVLCP